MRTENASDGLERDMRRMLYPAVIAVALFAAIPVISMIGLSFTDFDLIKGWSGGFGVDNFVELASDPRFMSSIGIMLALSGFGVLAQVLLGLFIAVGLEKIVPKWRLARGLLLVPFSVPHVAVALMWLSIFTPTLSPINQFFDVFGITVPPFLTTQYGAIFAIVVADTWSSFPFVMLLLLAAMQGIPPDLDEAASMDGASSLSIFFLITLPLLVPALLMVALFRLIETFKHFPLIHIMTSGGPGRSTQATNYYAYLETFQNSHLAYGSAIAVFLFSLAAIISFYVARANQRIGNA